MEAPAPIREYRVIERAGGWSVSLNGACTRPFVDRQAAERIAAHLQRQADKLNHVDRSTAHASVRLAPGVWVAPDGLQMQAHPPPAAEAVIEVCPDGSHWLIRSSDRLFSGVFVDLRSARRHAEAEAEAHPGHIVVIRDRLA